MGKTGGTSYTQASTGSKMPSLNNNLSELDTLLQDLSNARYNAHYQERGWLFRLLILSRTVNFFQRTRFLGIPCNPYLSFLKSGVKHKSFSYRSHRFE